MLKKMSGYCALMLLMSGLIAVAQESDAGYQISYVADEDEDRRREVYILDIDTGAEQRISTESENVLSAATWSPDGTQVAYLMQEASPRFQQLRVVNVETGDGITLINEADELELQTIPVWSPDGAWITLITLDDVNNTDLLLRLRADGSERQDLFSAGEGDLFNGGDLSPDGSYIAVRNDDALVRIDTATGEAQPMGDPTVNYRNPKWSPTGDWLLVRSSDDDQYYLISCDGSVTEQITTSSDNKTDATWSPDGEWIIFENNAESSNVRSLERMRPDGSAQETVITGFEAFSAIQWSGDGEWIVFEGRPNVEDSPEDVFRVRPDGSDLQNITDTPGNVFGPQISPIPGLSAPIESPACDSVE